VNKALLVLGIVAVGIPVYDQVAFQIDAKTGTATLPFIWQGSVASVISELWLAIIGAILILIAALVPLG
jgi:hypothetical protein